jgi:hypothetical protein
MSRNLAPPCLPRASIRRKATPTAPILLENIDG